MPKKIPTRRPRNLPTRAEQNALYEKKRRNRDPYRNWYHRAAWKALRKQVLENNPFCVRCKRRGIVTVADTVNHIKKHESDEELFYDIENLESVCASCHGREIQSEEKRRS
ncbi:MAG: HNH endonuclease [Henriciella sp.]|nr:HNH endonuclease [Henriciella sp.]MBO6694621.1 HNH endonuclease [Henriciella sp.]